MKESSPAQEHIVVRIRRRPPHAWLSWLLWGLVLAVLLEYAVSSLYEHETQAAVIAGLVFIFVLSGGLIYGYMRRIEAEEREGDI